MKIYDDDIVVPYKSTKINPLQTQGEINGLLARWGVKKYGWEWEPEKNNVSVTFQFTEVVEGNEIMPIIKLIPPVIWRKANPRKRIVESVNWTISMRVLWWYLKSHLEYIYLNQSSKTSAFLSYVQVPNLDGKQGDLIKVIINDFNGLKALPQKQEELIEK